ncbi:MAG: bifunctional DNA-formamidopyrimidine glycosylase/DNA-(apurinic or apyrimidinic site) lyase, partial [Mycoplasmataceae bacterium]|nr:bifunctional DNA-formamidopyrimidine glycosylase/DNA-(apurinic or apyrimidinic site) lyase [Mycoplasmataceae bacterium]
MPELPEVQTVVNNLNNSNAINNKIISVSVLSPKLLKNATTSEFTKFVVNEKIVSFKRKGKYIECYLSNKKVILIHLRMEGKLFCENKKIISSQNEMTEGKYWSEAKLGNSEFKNLHPPMKHLRISLILVNEWFLNFYDSRMFGTFHIYTLTSLADSPELKKVGYDAIGDDFNDKYLYEITRNSSKAIKTFILDQSKVSGIGNIYADEILFASKINPMMDTKNITIKQCHDFVVNTKQILNESILSGGTTFATFASDNQHIGAYQNKLKVYGKTNQKCLVCGTMIKKTTVNGRGTHYCPK